MPVILGPDGPSLGGFVCPVTIVDAELWKIGQLRPGDKLRFRRVTTTARATRRQSLDTARRGRRRPRMPRSACGAPAKATCWWSSARRCSTWCCASRCRRCSTCSARTNSPASSISRRAFVRCRSTSIRRASRNAVFSTGCWTRSRRLPSVDRMRLPSRIVHLPLSWDDPATQLATARYAIGARRCALVSRQHRIHPPHQWAGIARRSARDRVRRQLPGHGTGRRVPRRAGGDAARSAASAGHDQVQPGADLDAGKCGRHRRRLPVRVRHGRTRRLSIRRPHRADVESLPTDGETSATAGNGCCGSSTRFASIR